MVKKRKKQMLFHTIKRYAIENKSLLIICVGYVALLLSVISWGIPNNSHPYTYHMDEWHQLQAVKATFKNLTPNIEGAAHGTIFHFLLTGIYLVPFYIFGIINPFIIKSGLSAIPMQANLFELLRLNTLLFGIGSLFILNHIIKKYFKINPTVTLVLFTFTPVWIYLSNYFKYDIALTFWILTTIFFLLKFGSKPNVRNYIVAGIAASLTLAVKLSALPLLPIYIFGFFYFTEPKRRQYKTLFVGAITFVAVFLLVGIPDVLLGKANYGDFLSSNLIATSTTTGNFILDYRPWWLYILLRVMPLDFGHGFFVIFLMSILYWTVIFIKKISTKDMLLIKNMLFIFISLVVFAASLWPLQIGATGNRLLVLLPFLAIASGVFLPHIKIRVSRWGRRVVVLLIIFILSLQLLESLAIIYIKNGTDARQASSAWLVDNVRKGSMIGIENIPIYQLLPDVALKEFYEKQNNPTVKTNFNYEVIDASTKELPSIIIVTNKELEGEYLKKSPKKDLLKRLDREGYVVKREFKPSPLLYFIMENELQMFTSGLVPIPTITIYIK